MGPSGEHLKGSAGNCTRLLARLTHLGGCRSRNEEAGRAANGQEAGSYEAKTDQGRERERELTPRVNLGATFIVSQP
jgi:hypothetical protein